MNQLKNFKHTGMLFSCLMIISPIMIFFFSLFLFPIPPKTGLNFRYRIILPLAAISMTSLAGYFIKGRWGILFRLSFIFFIFALPLYGAWSNGVFEPGLVSGLFPYSDPGNYYQDSLRLLNGMNFESLATRRPLFPGLLSGFLLVSNFNLQITSAIFVFLSAWCIFLLSEKLIQTEGLFSSIAFIALFFLYYRRFIGLQSTEHLGVAFGLLSLALLIHSDKRNTPFSAILGILSLSFGLNARAGAFFILPFLVIWTGLRFRGSAFYSWRWFIFASLAVLLGFLINIVIFKIVAAHDTMLFSNYLYTLYGIVRGGRSWTYLSQQYPQINDLMQSERLLFTLSLVMDSLKTEPELALQGILKAFSGFFNISSSSGLFGFVNPGEVYIYAQHEFGKTPLYNFARYSLVFLALVGVFLRWINKRNSRALVAMACLGILFSIPFVPPGDADRMRAYAATIPYIIWLPASGLQMIMDKIKIKGLDWKSVHPIPEKILFLSAFFLLLITTLSPVWVKLSARQSDLPDYKCPDGLDAFYIKISAGTYITIVENLPREQTRLPFIGQATFQRNAHDLPRYPMVQFFTQLSAGNTLTATIDQYTGQYIWLIIPEPSIGEIFGNYYICGQEITEPDLPISPVTVTLLKNAT